MSLMIHLLKIRLREGSEVKEMRVFKFKDLYFGHLTVDTVDKTTDFHHYPTTTPCDHTPNSGFLGLKLIDNEENLKVGKQTLALKAL